MSQFSDRGALRRWRRRNVLASALVLVLAAIVLQSSAAGTSSKPYTATITPTTLVGGTTTSVTFSIINNANPQTLGSVNLTAPSGFSNASYVIASGPGTIDPTSTSTVLKLRNLNLAPSAKVTVTMDTTAPCAGGSYPWSLKVKQSNDFNGPPGNDFSGVAPTTQVTGGCTLDWGNEPASAVKSDTITSAPYDELGDPVTVRAVDPDGNTITSVNGLQVSLGNAATTGCPAATGFSGTSTTMVNGVAEFTGLTSADAAFNCHLVGSATGYQSTPSSGAFNISLAKATCTGSVGCSLPGISLDTDTKVDSSTSNGSFRFLAIGPAEIPSSVTATGAGCANFRPIGGAVFDEADGGGSGTKTFRYYVDKSILPKQFQSSSGQQFLPICAGGTRLGDDGKPLSCLDDTQGGWVDKTLDSSGKMTSIYSTAQCDPGTGLWWGILPSFQDVNPAGIDPGSNPLVTGWGSSTNARYFDISVPSPWDWRAGT